MAKELPYFKFEPSEWQNGNIQMCSKESKEAFIEICCSYWLKLGILSYAFALQKHCNGNKSLINELLDANVITLEKDQIVIKFLDIQLNEFQETSVKRRESAKKRWNNKDAMQLHSKSNAIREDNITLDNIKEKKKKIKVRENISLFPSEIEKLNNSFISTEIEWMYDKLSAYKLSKGKQYKSDYGAILNWVVKSMNEEKEKRSEKNENKGYINSLLTAAEKAKQHFENESNSTN